MSRAHLTNRLLLGLAALLRRYPFRGKTALWEAVAPRLQHTTVWIRLPHGAWMLFDLSQYWQRIMLAGCFERREYALVGILLQPGDVFIDGGANCGLYSCLAMSVIGRGRVYAFEPDPRVFPQLQAQAEHNQPGLHASQTALGGVPGTTDFYIPFEGDVEGWTKGLGRCSPVDGWEKLVVAQTTIDAFVESLGLQRVTLAKLDLEGREVDALRGARLSLRRGLVESVIVEVAEEHRADLVRELSQYEFPVIVDVRRGLRPLKRIEDLPHGQTDLLVARGACAARWRRLTWQRWLL